jgi:hypothetical protein
VGPRERGPGKLDLCEKKESVMTMAAEKQVEKIGTSRGSKDHDYDLIHELDRRLGFLWRCDQYIANAEGNSDLQTFWRDLKRAEQKNVERLRELVVGEVKKGCF